MKQQLELNIQFSSSIVILQSYEIYGVVLHLLCQPVFSGRVLLFCFPGNPALVELPCPCQWMGSVETGPLCFCSWGLFVTLPRVGAKLVVSKPLTQSREIILLSSPNPLGQSTFLYVSPKMTASHSATHSNPLRGSPRGPGLSLPFSLLKS